MSDALMVTAASAWPTKPPIALVMPAVLIVRRFTSEFVTVTAPLTLPNIPPIAAVSTASEVIFELAITTLSTVAPFAVPARIPTLEAASANSTLALPIPKFWIVAPSTATNNPFVVEESFVIVYPCPLNVPANGTSAEPIPAKSPSNSMFAAKCTVRPANVFD